MSDKKLKVTLVKSTIGVVPKNRKVVESMGFKKLNSSVILPDNAATRGQLAKIGYFVRVEEVEEA
ncbi:MAG: 50S ribosomal protein L30 [Lachnospiraceae bacterium]|nr:50S ribosomal protein L30 [Lachnospiraceae bacterium]